MPFRGTEIEQIDADLRAARSALRERQHVLQLLHDHERKARELEEHIARLEKVVAREGKQSEQLERRGPLTLIYTVLGSIEERRDRERQEAVAAALKVDEARAEAGLLVQQRSELERRARDLEGAEARLAEVRARKRSWLESHDQEAARKLAALGDEEARLAAELREIGEAAIAGERAAEMAAKVHGLVSAASGWGTLDLLGGKMISSWAKHDRLDDARQLIPQLQVALQRLLSEAKDVGISFEIPELALAQGSRLVDVFFDNIISDWASRAALSHTEDSLRRVVRIIEALSAELLKQTRQTRANLGRIRAEREALLG